MTCSSISSLILHGRWYFHSSLSSAQVSKQNTAPVFKRNRLGKRGEKISDYWFPIFFLFPELPKFNFILLVLSTSRFETGSRKLQCLHCHRKWDLILPNSELIFLTEGFFNEDNSWVQICWSFLDANLRKKQISLWLYSIVSTGILKSVSKKQIHASSANSSDKGFLKLVWLFSGLFSLL